MGTPSKEWLADYREKNREKLKEQQSARDDRKRKAFAEDPEKREKRLQKQRELARAKVLARQAADTTRTCKHCGKTAPKQEFKRFGSGWSDECLICSPVLTPAQIEQRRRDKMRANRPPKAEVPKVPKPVKKRERQKRVAPKKTVPPKEQGFQFSAPVIEPTRRLGAFLVNQSGEKLPWYTKFTRDGWRMLGSGVGDDQESITPFIRGMILMYIVGHKGHVGVGKATFAVLFDDAKPKLMTLARAEARARKLYGDSA